MRSWGSGSEAVGRPPFAGLLVPGGLARRLIPELELQNYEAALERHEAAIQAHEDLLHSHEEAVDLSRRAGDRAAEEYETVHAQLDGRHLRSRDLHQHLQRTHRAVLRAIAMVAKEI